MKRSLNSGELVLALGDFGRLSTSSVVFHSNPPAYAPPEASKRGVLFDAGPADVYSCGTCLLQLVALTYWSVEVRGVRLIISLKYFEYHSITHSHHCTLNC